MTEQPTYTETLHRNNELLTELLRHFRENGRSSAGIIESQLDHVIRGVGELKAEVAHNRKETEKQFQNVQDCLTTIKVDCAKANQWQEGHEGRCDTMERDISDLEKRVNKMAAGNGLLAVIGSILATVIGTQT